VFGDWSGCRDPAPGPETTRGRVTLGISRSAGGAARAPGPSRAAAVGRSGAVRTTGKHLTGSAGPVKQQWTIDKGTVNGGKATFEVQQPDGPLFKCALTIVKGRLQGDMTGERDGTVRGHAKVEASRGK
jgi:hypothetical protein